EERKRTEEALKEGERKFRAIFDQTFEFMGLLTVDGRLIEANKTVLQFSGVQESDVIGKLFWETPWWKHSTEQQEMLRVAVKKAVAGEFVRFETVHPAADGSLHCTDFSLKPVMDEAGGIVFLIAEARDINERKRAEEALQQSEREKAILNQIANVFLTIPDEKIFEEVLAVILKTLKCRYGVFGYIGDGGDLIIPSMTKEIWSDCQVEGKSIVFPRHLWGDSLWGKAIKEKKSFSSDGPFQTPEGHLPIYNFLTVPVVFADKTIGLASVANKDGGFSVEDKTVLERIAGNISPILNARLQRDKQELERKRAEEALRESEERLRQIIDLVPHMIFVKDWDGKYLLVNKAVAEANNTSVSALTGKYHADFHPYQSELQNMLQDDREVMTKGKTKFISEEPCTDAQGNLRFLQTTKVPFHLPGDKTPAVLGVAIDITDKKRAEEVLRESEAKYRLISENTGDVIWQFDLPTDQFVYVSPSVHRLLGFTPEEVVGQKMEAILTPASMQYVTKQLPQVIAAFNAGDESVRVTTHEVEQLHKDGSVVPTEVVSTLLQDAAGRVDRIIGVSRDITEQRHAAEALRESETKFRTLVDTMMEGVALHEIIYDEQGMAVDYRILSVNPAFEKHTGLKSEQVLGQLASKIYGIDKAPYLERYALVAGSGEPDSFETYFPSMNRFFRISVTSQKPSYFATVFENITRRKQAEDALKESEQQLANIIDFLPDATFVINNEGEVIAWNKAIEEMTGVKASDMLGRGDYEYALPFYGERRPILIDLVRNPQEDILSKYIRITRRTNEIAGEAYMPALRAGKTCLYGTASVLRDSSGNIVGAIESIRDITEHKQAEDALREGEERFSRFFRATPVGTSITLLSDDQFADINDVFLDLFGYTREEVIGHNPLELGIWADPEDRVKMFKILQEQGRVKDFETKFRRKSGEIRNVCLSTEVIEAAGQQYLLGLTHDITERKRIDEKLQENQSRLELALRSAHMGVWHWDLIKDKRFFDDQVCRLLGIDPAKFTGTADEFFNVVHPDDREMLKAALARTIEQDVPYATEYRAVWPDGSVHYIIAHAKLFCDETGQRVRLNGLIWDITERKRAEEEKDMLEAELRQAQKVEAIGILAGGIAHDFNNILQPIIGYTEMALNDLSPSSPQRKSLEQVLNASIRAKNLIRQILAVSRSTQEQQRIPTDISSIIKEALKLLRSSLPTSIEMRQKIRKGIALADPTQIHQVLMNLCTNAAHAMDDKGILEVRLSPVDLSESDLAVQSIFDLKPGPYLRLTVSDTGCGIDGKTMERIFDPYFTTKEVGKGSGLGLAVVNGIVKRHEGAVTVRSEPGKGTTFSVYLPRIDVESEATMQVEDLLLRGSERILLVDDESAVTGVVTELLETLGYKVTSRADSVDALEVFRSSPGGFDLVITDYTMPKLTGLDFAREVLRLRPDIPILLCTGFSEKITPDSVKELGMELLMKPYGMRQISEAVRKILDARRGG
ncbi:MAG: PAS domain S-box protein, partial [Syntrophobacteraceae bacterium]